MSTRARQRHDCEWNHPRSGCHGLECDTTIPMSDPQKDGAENDLAVAATPASVRAAGAALFATGAFGLLHVVQLFGVLTTIRGPFAFVPHLRQSDAHHESSHGL